MTENQSRRFFTVEYIDEDGERQRHAVFGDTPEETVEMVARSLIKSGMAQETEIVEWCLDDGSGNHPDATDGIRPCGRKLITAEQDRSGGPETEQSYREKMGSLTWKSTPSRPEKIAQPVSIVMGRNLVSSSKSKSGPLEVALRKVDRDIRRAFNPKHDKDSAKPADDIRSYKVFVDDNFHYMDEDERYELGKFDTLDEAITKCREIVDRDLEHMFKEGMSADELYDMYVGFGEDPWIACGGFSAWGYAKARCAEICSRQ